MAGTTPILNDRIQFRVVCSAGDQISMNVLHYRVANVGGGGLTLQQMATAYATLIGTLYRSLMPTTALFQYVDAKNISFPPTVAFRQTSSSAGTAIGDLLPRQVSCLISTQTELAGKANRGRVYVGLVSDTFADASGELTGAGFAILVNIASAIGSAIFLSFGGASTAMNLVIRHPDTPGPIISPVTTDVVSMVPRTGFATQRRRGDFGRSNRV